MSPWGVDIQKLSWHLVFSRNPTHCLSIHWWLLPKSMLTSDDCQVMIFLFPSFLLCLLVGISFKEEISPHPVYLYFYLYQVWTHEFQLIQWVVICYCHCLFWCLKLCHLWPLGAPSDSSVFLTCFIFFELFRTLWQNKITHAHLFPFFSSGNNYFSKDPSFLLVEEDI